MIGYGTKRKRYFLNFFKSNCVKRAFEGKQNQSTQKYLKANHIEDLIIPVPSLEKQKVVVQKAFDEAKLSFDSLMQKYFA